MRSIIWTASEAREEAADEVERRLARGGGLSLIRAELDGFGAYREAYGGARADAVLEETRTLLRDALARAGDSGGFVGRLGDGFVIVCSEELGELAAAFAVIAFDDAAPFMHDAEDVARGRVLCMTAGGVSTRRRRLQGYAAAAALAGEMLERHRSRDGQGGSAWAFNRERQAGDAGVSRI